MSYGSLAAIRRQDVNRSPYPAYRGGDFVFYRFCKLFLFPFLFVLILFLAETPVSAAPGGQGKGKGKGAQQGGQKSQKSNAGGNGNPSSKASSNSHGSSTARSSSSTTRAEKLHPGQDRKNIGITDRGNASAKGKGQIKLGQSASFGEHGRGGEHWIRGHEAAMIHVGELLKSLNKMEKAKWSYHPRDERGQGNMGKVDMRDPYGFDKDGGREKSERGRAIKGATTEEASIVESAYAPGDVIAIGDPMITYYARTLIEYYEAAGNTGYADYLREFYSLVDVDLTNFTAPDTQFTFKLTVTDGFTVEKIMGVNFVGLVDFYALNEQLNDSAIDYWLGNVEGSRTAAEENPRLGLTAYATTMELYLSNYLIAAYPEIAEQIVDGTYQL